MDKLIASEAVYGFAAWLTCREEEVIMGAKHNAAIVAELVDVFCRENKLEKPRDDWAKNLTHPR